MIGSWHRLNARLNGTYWPALIALASIVFVMLLLFAYPLVSAAIGLVLPFSALGVFAALLLAMNLRWTLWHGTRPVSFSIADLGFFLCFAAFALYGFAYMSDSWTNFPYVLIGFVIVAVFRVAFVEFEAWWLGVLLCGVLVLVFGPYMAFTLSEPSWFFDFGPSLLLLPGILLLLAGSVFALLESPASSKRENWPAWLKAATGIAGLVLAVSLATSGVLTISDREGVPAAEAEGAHRVVFEGGRTDLRRTTWPAGPGRLLVVNQDLRVHTFTVEDLGIDVVVGPRSETLVQVDLPAGDYRFECGVPGHSESAGFRVE